MKRTYIFVAMAVVALLFSGINLYAQWEGGAPPAEDGKAKKPKPPQGDKPQANKGSIVERMKKRLEQISPDIPPVLDELKDADQRLVGMKINIFLRDSRTLMTLKKTNEEAFNRKVKIFILELKAIPLIQEVKKAFNEVAKEDAKKKLIEHLKELMGLQKIELEETIKELQAKLDEYKNNPEEALKKQADELTQEKAKPQPKKNVKPPKKKKEKKEKDQGEGGQGDAGNGGDAQLF